MSMLRRLRSLKPQRLALCVSVAIAWNLDASQPSSAAAFDQFRTSKSLLPQSSIEGGAPTWSAILSSTTENPPTPYVVTTCDDNTSNPPPGSLRAEIASAPSGSTIDLSSLAMVCSTITLDSEIVVPQLNLYLQGSANSVLTIDGNHSSRIFKHTGAAGHFNITNLALTNGYYTKHGLALGGCIYSSGSVGVVSSVVSHCLLRGNGAGNSEIAEGGAIYTKGSLALLHATITDNEAYALDMTHAVGGAAFVKADFYSKYSTVSNNKAFDGANPCSSNSGGVAVYKDVSIIGTTIAGNRACTNAGLFIGLAGSSVAITNSTISGNVASRSVGGIRSNKSLTLSNSTIAFNEGASSYLGFAGLHMASGTTLNVESSIIADNVAGSTASDLGGGAAVIGSNNLIVSSLPILPVDTITECPQLDLLGDNGGTTRTHALSSSSPAVDSGNNGAQLTQDQRGADRLIGAAADIGAVEAKLGEHGERVFVSGFDGLCDR